MAWFPEHLKSLESCTVPMKNKHIINVGCGLQGHYRSFTDDLTFMIPYGTDSQNRFENLCDVISWIFLTTTAKMEIYISECRESLDKFKWIDIDAFYKIKQDHSIEDANRAILEVLYDNICIHRLHKLEFKDQVQYANMFDNFCSRVNVTLTERKPGEPFHRMKYINEMLQNVTTPFVVNHDADVFLSRNSLLTSLSYLRGTDTDVVYPYDFGKSQVMIHERSGPGSVNLETAIITGDTSKLIATLGYGTMIWDARYGQSIFYKTSSYRKMYGENENFVSWGPEDVERYVRAIKFGFKIGRVPGYVFHLEHPRGNNSSSTNPRFLANEKLWEELQDLNPDKLEEYYKNQDYVKIYKWS